jgi:hypothetical protein
MLWGSARTVRAVDTEVDGDLVSHGHSHRIWARRRDHAGRGRIYQMLDADGGSCSGEITQVGGGRAAALCVTYSIVNTTCTASFNRRHVQNF